MSRSLVVFNIQNGTSEIVHLRKPRWRIGRTSDNELVLDDTQVSRHHAVMKVVHGFTWIMDTDSRNGLFVNGRRTRGALLADGDVLRLGQTVIRFQQVTGLGSTGSVAGT